MLIPLNALRARVRVRGHGVPPVLDLTCCPPPVDKYISHNTDPKNEKLTTPHPLRSPQKIFPAKKPKVNKLDTYRKES